jgi:hypothetical protein
MDKGDENTKFFHAYAKGRKSKNTIWKLQDQEGRMVSTFEGLDEMGKNHLKSLFKAGQRENIADIVRLSIYYQRFVDEEWNRNIFVEGNNRN